MLKRRSYKNEHVGVPNTSIRGFVKEPKLPEGLHWSMYRMTKVCGHCLFSKTKTKGDVGFLN